MDLTTLFRLSQPHSQEAVSPIRMGRIGRHIGSNPIIHHDINTLRIAHASSYCLAVRLLSSGAVDARTFRFWNPKNGLLDNLDWFKISFPEHLPPDVVEKLIVQLHISANRIIAFIAAELRYALANGFFDRDRVVGLAPLPTVSGISIESSLTVASCPQAPTLQTFIPSHVPYTARLEWFTESSWTGYFSRTGEQLAEFARVFTMYGDHFDGIGAKSIDSKDYNQRYPGIPCLIESFVRFRCIPAVREPDFSLQSNYFYSQTGLHSLQLRVNAQTGTFHMTHLQDKHHRGTSYGVITPFGLITACVPGSLWLWLWKVDWCT